MIDLWDRHVRGAIGNSEPLFFQAILTIESLIMLNAFLLDNNQVNEWGGEDRVLWKNETFLVMDFYVVFSISFS